MIVGRGERPLVRKLARLFRLLRQTSLGPPAPETWPASSTRHVFGRGGRHALEADAPGRTLVSGKSYFAPHFARRAFLATIPPREPERLMTR